MTRLTDEQVAANGDAFTALEQFGAGEGRWAVIVPRVGSRALAVVTSGGPGAALVRLAGAPVEVGDGPSDWDQAVSVAGFRPADPYEDGRMRWHAGSGGAWIGRVTT